MSRVRLQVFYTGNVQGVGFRYAAKQAASAYEVTGMVRNLLDGRVELVVEGERAELEAFQEGIREAGLRRLIRGEQVHWSEAGGEFRGFEIVR